MNDSLVRWMAALLLLSAATGSPAATLRGTVLDEDTGQPLAARVYIRSEQGEWYFAASADPAGKAVPYKKQRGDRSVEMHTALSAHPFEVELPPGKYTLTVERGKEYLPAQSQVEMTDRAESIKIKLRRWINLADRGWYSGDTHVHRTLEELPTAMLADDVNVAFPLTYWVTKSDTPPAQGDKNLPAAEPKLIEVSPQHVIWPLNTEYEIFTVGGKQHTLGAVFGLGHKTVLARGVPPVRPIAEQVHREGGLLDLDKHNWPWSMALVPVMDVDLFELANNHHWRTEFAFRSFGEPIPAYMNLPRDPAGFDEKAWTEFGFQNYYALLNCGFRMMPTAGTASGVHPVPLGWGRVYVNCPEGFSYEAWMKGLKEGRSFVTTGPFAMLEVATSPPEEIIRTAPRKENPAGVYGPGSVIRQQAEAAKYWVNVTASAASHDCSYELVTSGRVTPREKLRHSPDTVVGVNGLELGTVRESTWVALRVFETDESGRERFAHTAPIFIDVPGKPLRPRKAEVEYLMQRVQDQIERNQGVLSDEALAEFREALAYYQKIAETAQ